MKHYLLAALCALAASCVTSGDIARIEQAQSQYRVEVDRALSDLGDESITRDEAEDEISDAQARLRAEIEATIRQVDERTTAIATAARELPTDPVSLLTYLLGMGGTIAGSVVATNRVRDQRRSMRGEPTVTHRS